MKVKGYSANYSLIPDCAQDIERVILTVWNFARVPEITLFFSGQAQVSAPPLFFLSQDMHQEHCGIPREAEYRWWIGRFRIIRREKLIRLKISHHFPLAMAT